jgi:hypothetical protein
MMETSFRPLNLAGSASFDEGITVLLPDLRVNGIVGQWHGYTVAIPALRWKSDGSGPVRPNGRLFQPSPPQSRAANWPAWPFPPARGAVTANVERARLIGLQHGRLAGLHQVLQPAYWDLPVLAHFSPQARCGQCHRYRILVHVKPDMCDRLRHDPSAGAPQALVDSYA